MPDAIIAGAGPVGLLLGCLLAGRGVDVLVCEKRDGADDRTRAIGIHPPGLAALDDAGAGEAVRAEAVLLDRGEVHARGRMLASVPFGAARPVMTLAQTRTDALLRARLHELGGELRTGTAVRGFLDEGPRVAVRFAGEEERHAAFLVVADGVRSPLRRAVGVGWRARGGAAQYAMIDVPDEGEDRVARIHCEPGGLVESFPLPAGARRWVVRTTGGDRMTADRFADVIRSRTGIRVRIPDGASPTTFTAAQHRAARFARGRVALLGDAAREISPIGGQGMNLGWSDAATLASAMRDALRGGTPDLDGYARRASRRAAAAQRRSSFYMAMGAPVPMPVQRVRESAIRALGSPPLRARAAELVTMGGL